MVWPFGPPKVEVPFKIRNAPGSLGDIEAIIVQTPSVTHAEHVALELVEKLDGRIIRKGNL